MILELSTDRSLERAKAAAMLLSSGWGWKEAPSGPVQPCHAECSWGCTAGLGTKAKPLAAYRRRLCCLSEHDQYNPSLVCDSSIVPIFFPTPLASISLMVTVVLAA